MFLCRGNGKGREGERNCQREMIAKRSRRRGAPKRWMCVVHTNCVFHETSELVIIRTRLELQCQSVRGAPPGLAASAREGGGFVGVWG